LGGVVFGLIASAAGLKVTFIAAAGVTLASFITYMTAPKFQVEK
jgi:hypothetical protein